MRLRPSILLAFLLPFSAQAASIVPGFTEITVGEKGYVSVSLTLAGPAKGPLTVGLLKGKKVSRPTPLELTNLPAGEFATVMAEIRVGRNVVGTHTVGVEGPKGIVAKTMITIVPGPKQETLMGAKSKMMQTFLQKRDSDLKRGFIDDSGEGLVAVFFLKVKATGEAYNVDFLHKGKRVCGDLVYPAGFKGQVVQVRARCLKGEAKEIVETDDVILDDDSAMYEPVPVGGTGDIKVADQASEPVLTLAETYELKGPWKVQVKKDKKLKRILTFSVKGGKVVAGAPGKAPLKLARVKVVSP